MFKHIMYDSSVTELALKQCAMYKRLLQEIDHKNTIKINKILRSRSFTKDTLIPPSDEYENCLMYACTNGNASVVKCILKSNKCSKKLLQYCTKRGDILYYACLRGDIDILKTITKCKLYNKKLINNEQIMHILVDNNGYDCLEHLLNLNFLKYDISLLWYAYVTNHMFFDRFIGSQFMTTELMTTLQRKIMSNLNESNINSFECLLKSSVLTHEILLNDYAYIKLFGENGNDQLAMKFIESDKFTYDIAKRANKYGANCLHFAFAYRSIEIILKILDNEWFDSSLITLVDNDGDTLLNYLYFIKNHMQRSRSDLAKILDHPKILPHIIPLLLPNLYCICTEYFEFFKYLLQLEFVSAELLEKNIDNDGWTYLFACARWHPNELINILDMEKCTREFVSICSKPDDDFEYDDYGDLRNAVKSGGQTFLHILAFNHYDVFCKIVLHEKVSHILHIKDNLGNTCFDFLEHGTKNEHVKCNICYKYTNFVRLNCGHVCCEECVKLLYVCHMCKCDITTHDKIYL